MTAQGHRIFVSHSHLDNDFGTKFAQDLRRALNDESAVWYDVLGGLHGGETWWEKIIEELTARDVFIVALSPDAMNSSWVRLEIDMAFNENKFIIPVLHRNCSIRADLKIKQIISFLAPKPYEQAFQEVLLALALPTSTPIEPMKQAISPSDPSASLLGQLQAAFAVHDWPDVIRKADYLIKRMPGGALALVYRMQGVALLEEGEEQQAQEAFETALALVSDRELRLTLLSDSTALLAKQGQWTKVQQRAKEALRLVPHDPGWLATQQQAQSELAKTKAQWLDEGNALNNLKRYEEAIIAYDQAIRLDPNVTSAYHNKGYALDNLKRYEEAIATYDQAIRLDPTYAFAVVGKGYALNNLKRYEEAIATYDQAIRLDPNDAAAYHNKGYALENLGKKTEAQQAYARAIQLGYRS
jgi:tetratricopeptide (TPR) repeat protein